MISKAIILGSLALAGVAYSTPLKHPQTYYEGKFYDWMLKHNVNFQDAEEFVYRLQVFSQNDDFIESHNAAGLSYSLDHNQFSHMSFEEFKSKYLGFTKPEHESNRAVNEFDGVETAASIDWVSKGAVTGVKDQGSCGSCWAFSTTGGMEGAYFLSKGSLKSFSEQQLVDCDTNGDHGCNGGLMDNAFEWIQSNGGICLESDYAYTAKNGVCKTTCSEVSGTKPTSWTDVAKTEDALEAALNQQPISVAIQANQLAFQFYRSGVLTGNCGTNVDHGVLAVGYGVYTDGTPYWKVKNSWGTSWGMDGYVLLEKGVSQRLGQCGICSDASYPSLSRTSDVQYSLEGTASASDCGGATAAFSSFTISPTDIQKNQKVTFTANGVLTKPTTSGSGTLSVIYAGATLYSTKVDPCADQSISLPLNVGTIHTNGFDCPAYPGDITYALDVTLPTIAPSGSYTISLRANDQDSTSLMCVDISLKL